MGDYPDTPWYPVPDEVPDHMEAYRTMPDVIFPIPANKYHGPELELHIHGMGGVALGSEGTGSWIIQVWQSRSGGRELLYSEANATRTPMGETHLGVAMGWASVAGEQERPGEPWASQVGDWVDQFCHLPE